MFKDGKQRNVRSEFFKQMSYMRLSAGAFRFMIALMCFADDAGDVDMDMVAFARRVAFKVGGTDPDEMYLWAEELHAEEILSYYEVRGHKYAYINGWHEPASPFYNASPKSGSQTKWRNPTIENPEGVDLTSKPIQKVETSNVVVKRGIKKTATPLSLAIKNGVTNDAHEEERYTGSIQSVEDADDSDGGEVVSRVQAGERRTGARVPGRKRVTEDVPVPDDNPPARKLRRRLKVATPTSGTKTPRTPPSVRPGRVKTALVNEYDRQQAVEAEYAALKTPKRTIGQKAGARPYRIAPQYKGRFDKFKATGEVDYLSGMQSMDYQELLEAKQISQKQHDYLVESI